MEQESENPLRRLGWLVLLVALLAVLTYLLARPAVTPQYVGTLRCNIVAIGGETTGTIIVTPSGTYELAFRDQPKLRDLARSLDGRCVVVEGELRVHKGIEMRERRIISVTSLKPYTPPSPPPLQPAPPPASSTGPA